MIKYFLLAFLLFPIPAFADNSTLPIPNSSMVKDFFGTVIDKVVLSNQQAGIANPGFGAVSNGTKQVISSGIDFLSAVKYALGAGVNWVGPLLLGHPLPWYITPIIIYGGSALTVIGILYHLKRIIIVALIIAIVVFLLLLLGSNLLSVVIPH